MSDDEGSDDNNNGTLSDASKKVLDGLTENEIRVLKQRFGIALDDDFSLEEIENQFDITRERIQNIEEKALRKLRKKHGKSLPHCSFCGKNNDEVERLLTSQISDVSICSECVKISIGLVDE